MSTALTVASRLKPEIRLAQAISQFEADLSNEQKIAFRTLKSQSLSSAPGPSDVMRLTAEIDRRMHTKAGGRCFGPRFTNFLQGVQQFAALGDVVIGGSQNMIACGVWSLVRMSLLSIVNFSSYLEKLSALFMDIGRAAPRYQSMALLYPKSRSLQSQMLEYFIVVVALCHYLLDFTQKSAFRKFTSTLSDSDLKTFQTDLDHWAHLIKDEASFIEAQENSRFRALSSKLSKRTAYQQKLATMLQLLNLCSTYDHQTTWKQTRKVGNATLFTTLTEYQEWKDSSSPCTLLFMGKLGSGKSVLLANIVDDLSIHVETEKSTVAYFFCRHDIPESLRARTILGSLVRQLLSTISDFNTVAEAFDETQSIKGTKELLKLLLHGFPRGRKAYFVLDGLDECDSPEREVLARDLLTIQKTLKLLLCISSRLDPNSALDPITQHLHSSTRIATIPDSNPDISAFISADLEARLQSQTLILGDPLLILEIQDALLQGSQGMFLWAALQIQSLCTLRTDEALRAALANLPTSLSETFSRILHKSRPSAPHHQSRILHLLATAHRPLTTEELREALSVIPADTDWTPSRLLNDVYATLACCGCLLTVDEEESTVRFIHPSVKQYVLLPPNNDNDNNADARISAPRIPFTTTAAAAAAAAQRTAADIVITYLNHGVFETEVSRARVPAVMVQGAPSSVMRAAVGSSGAVGSLAVKLLRARRQAGFDAGRTLAGARRPFHAGGQAEFRFYAYARVHWVDHVFFVSGADARMRGLAKRLIERRALEASVGGEEHWLERLVWAVGNGNEEVVRTVIRSGRVDGNLKDANGQTLLSQAARYGCEAVARLLLESEEIDVDSIDDSGNTALSWAVEGGYAAIVGLLLSRANMMLTNEDGLTPLLQAVKKGNEAVVEVLLQTAQIDIERKNDWGQTPLLQAARYGNWAIVKLLLDTNKVEADSMDNYGKTPLWCAVEVENEAVVKVLLESGKASVNLKTKDGQTPLSKAAENGNEVIVRLFLKARGLNVNLKNGDGHTPLSRAAEKGHESVVRLLLTTHKLDVNSLDKYGRTPLLTAAENGCEMIVKLLLETAKVEIMAKDQEEDTPLSLAAANGREAVVKMLLGTGKASVNSMDSDGRTPLFRATSCNWPTVVKLLLENDQVDINLPDNSGRTPLLWAAEQGLDAVVKLLLNTKKAEVNFMDNVGRTALLCASKNGHAKVVKLLLETGRVNVNALDGDGYTPLSCAAANRYEGVVELLQSYKLAH